MDEDQIHLPVKKCKHLKFKFRGVCAADNYPLNLQTNTFIIVNASRSNSIGTHWVVLAKRYAYPIIYFADPLALPLTTYKDIFNRLQQCKDLEIMMISWNIEETFSLHCNPQTPSFVVYFAYILFIIFIVRNFHLYLM